MICNKGNINIINSSNPFICLISCSWLLFIIIIFIYLVFISVGNIFMPGNNKTNHIISGETVPNISICICTGLILIVINYWIKDVIRENIKKYEVLIIMLFIVFLIFILSEGILFVSLFWITFHSSSSPCLSIWPQEGLYVADPCELTYTNTLLLSNAALSLGCTFNFRENNQGNQHILIISFILSLTFIILEIKEFHNVGFYINDSIFMNVFFFLTGLHFLHVIIGIILIGIILCITPINPVIFVSFHFYYNLQLIYWHFVELLWLFIYIILYSY